MSCLFCDGHHASSITPENRHKLFQIFDVSMSGRKQLFNAHMCTRCITNVELIGSALALKKDMQQWLQEKLISTEDSKIDGITLTPYLSPPNATVSNGVDIMRPTTPPVVIENHTHVEESASAYMCIDCGLSFETHTVLQDHQRNCSRGTEGEKPVTQDCDRCGQNLKTRTPEDRRRHALLCQGQGLPRGRRPVNAATMSCPKCGTNLKNRMTSARIRHIQSCTGNGLKRGRPSKQTIYRCDKCNRTLATHDQWETHTAKCNGELPKIVRGRKRGDNTCAVCGEDLVYRHILKKHLKQDHGFKDAINFDDNDIAALKLSASKNFPIILKSTPTTLMRNHTVSLNSHDTHVCGKCNIDFPSAELLDDHMTTSHAQTLEDSGSHRKQSRPCKYVPETEVFNCVNCQEKFEDSVAYAQHCLLCCDEVEDVKDESVNISQVEVDHSMENVGVDHSVENVFQAFNL